MCICKFFVSNIIIFVLSNEYGKTAPQDRYYGWVTARHWCEVMVK